MKKVDQIIISPENGDCTRACVASLFYLNIEEVPNFIEAGQGWFRDLWKFIHDHGYEFHGTGWPLGPDRPMGHRLKESPNVNGCVIASVHSRTFKHSHHSVITNLDGIVVHDPNPNKLWQDVGLIKENALDHWMMIEKI